MVLLPSCWISPFFVASLFLWYSGGPFLAVLSLHRPPCSISIESHLLQVVEFEVSLSQVGFDVFLVPLSVALGCISLQAVGHKALVLGGGYLAWE